MAHCLQNGCAESRQRRRGVAIRWRMAIKRTALGCKCRIQDQAALEGRAGIVRAWPRSIHSRFDGWAASRIVTRGTGSTSLVARDARADPRQLLLLEHPAVLTLGRHADAHVRARQRRRACGARHRAHPRRARRRGDVPRPGPAGRLSDREAGRARRPAAAVRPGAGAGHDRHRRGLRRGERPASRGYPAAGAIPSRPTRASSARSACASRVASATTASR